MMRPDIFETIGIALGLGLLVGMQREWSTSRIAGIRTFPLITLLGTLTAILAETFGGWIIATGGLAVAILLVVGNVAKFQQAKFDPGITTEASALVMFGVGAILVIGYTAVAIAIGGTVAVLLHLKVPLHNFVKKIGENDFKAIIQLVLIGFIILPVLPNQTYGWYDILNPYQIWLMVVLIAGISMCAYVAYKLLGTQNGTIVGGVLGGLISSTATTVSYARQSREQRDIVPVALLIILIASLMMHLRILFEIGVVAPTFFIQAAPPLAVMILVMVVVGIVIYWRTGYQNVAPPTYENPAQLKTALIFGGLYAAILFAVAATKTHFGTGGIYFVAFLSGLTDMDAITLSTAELVNTNRMDGDTGWRVVLLASMSNLLFKEATIALLGSRRLLIPVSVMFGILFTINLLLLVFWS